MIIWKKYMLVCNGTRIIQLATAACFAVVSLYQLIKSEQCASDSENVCP